MSRTWFSLNSEIRTSEKLRDMEPAGDVDDETTLVFSEDLEQDSDNAIDMKQ